MKILSVFVDESGDFGRYDYHSPFYIISLVFHNQENDLTNDLQFLENKLSEIGYKNFSVHCGPLIRAENEYRAGSIDLDTRKRILRRLMSFVSHSEIRYETIHINKKHIIDEVEATTKLSKQLSDLINENREWLVGFDQINVYYDYGQSGVTKILTSVFSALLGNVIFKKVTPSKYRLFQVADLVCTLKLVSLKMESKMASKTEMTFFEDEKSFKNNYVKALKRKKLQNKKGGF